MRPTGRGQKEPSAKSQRNPALRQTVQDYFTYQCADTETRGPAGSNPSNNTSAH